MEYKNVLERTESKYGGLVVLSLSALASIFVDD